MEAKRDYKIGDYIPLDQAEKSDTYFLVVLNGRKYLVDQNGKVILDQMAFSRGSNLETGKDRSSEPIEWLPLEPLPEAGPIKFRVRPGTPEFIQAVQEAESVLLSFFDLARKYYPRLAPRFEAYLENTRMPYAKYFERGKDGLSNIKGYLILEFFRRTIILERGLEILEFLTAFIARRMNGAFSHDQQFSPAEQKALITGFLDFVWELGDTPACKQIVSLTCSDFVHQEYELIKCHDRMNSYISVSLSGALTTQMVLLRSPESRVQKEAVFRRLIEDDTEFFLDNMLAFVKSMAILRFIANSGSEEHRINAKELEWLVYAVIAYRPSWYR